jgi:hypothetical protein
MAQRTGNANCVTSCSKGGINELQLLCMGREGPHAVMQLVTAPGLTPHPDHHH